MTEAPPSLARRALLALLLMVGFYALGAATIMLVLYLPYAEFRYLHHISVRLVVFSLVGAGAILGGVLPRIDRFPDPGPRLTAAGQPRLFAMLTPLAKATGQAEPKHVFLVPDLNAWVAQRGGLMGIGSHRVMGIGLPLLEALSVNELRAVLAHEFGHFHGGDTKLGPWLYKTRAGIGRTIENLKAAKSWLQGPFVWYGHAFLRITHAVSRSQALAADRLAAAVVGPEALASGLKKLHAAAPLFEAYWSAEVVPPLEGGFRPPIGDGFARFLVAAESGGDTKTALERELSRTSTDPYDTHPPLGERLAALPATASATDATEAAITLLDDADRLEQAVLAYLPPSEVARSLHAVTWEALPATFWMPLWEDIVRHAPERFVGLTPAGLAEFADHPAQPAVRLRLAPDEERATPGHIARASMLVGAMLAVLLESRGWRVRGEPGRTPPSLVTASGSGRSTCSAGSSTAPCPRWPGWEVVGDRACRRRSRGPRGLPARAGGVAGEPVAPRRPVAPTGPRQSHVAGRHRAAPGSAAAGNGAYECQPLRQVRMRRLVTVAALAFSSLGGVCARGRERPPASTSPPAAAHVVHDTGPWARVAGSRQREELDTTTIIRSDSNVYAGWVRRPWSSAQGDSESYRVRYEVDCLAGLVRTTRAAVYDERGKLKHAVSPADIARSGEDRWWAARSRDLEVVARAICDRVQDGHLPISRVRRH